MYLPIMLMLRNDDCNYRRGEIADVLSESRLFSGPMTHHGAYAKNKRKKRALARQFIERAEQEEIKRLTNQ